MIPLWRVTFFALNLSLKVAIFLRFLTPSMMAGMPGMRSLTSTPAFWSASGSSALTCPNPPVLIKGKISVVTYKTFIIYEISFAF